MSRFPSRTTPGCGRWKPESTFTSVVLPAPLGPINPSISPPRKAIDTPSITVSQPNRTGRRSAARSMPTVSAVPLPILSEFRELFDREASFGSELALVHADDRHRPHRFDMDFRRPCRRADHQRLLVERVEHGRHLVAVERARLVRGQRPGLDRRVTAQAVGYVGLLAELLFEALEEGVHVRVRIVAV